VLEGMWKYTRQTVNYSEVVHRGDTHWDGLCCQSSNFVMSYLPIPPKNTSLPTYATHLHITEPRRFLANVSDPADAQCTANDGGQRVICGTPSSTMSYFATWCGMSITSDVMRRLFRLGPFDCTQRFIFTSSTSRTVYANIVKPNNLSYLTPVLYTILFKINKQNHSITNYQQQSST